MRQGTLLLLPSRRGTLQLLPVSTGAIITDGTQVDCGGGLKNGSSASGSRRDVVGRARSERAERERAERERECVTR